MAHGDPPPGTDRFRAVSRAAPSGPAGPRRFPRGTGQPVPPSLSSRRRRHRLRRILWGVLGTLILVLLAIRYVTREAFIRGPILHRVLGPRYENNLRIGTIRVGLFPPRIRMFNVELIDRRPGPDEPVVVASLGKMALDFRLLPSNTLMVDRVELRGLELEVRRNERGGVNLLRALADMQEGRVPSPIRYEALTGTEASGRRILVGFWDGTALVYDLAGMLKQ